MNSHPAAELFPMLNEEDLQSLVLDIQNRGLLEPLVIHEGLILDGRNRHAACVAAGVAPRMIKWDGRGGTPTQYVLSINLERRHLSKSQRAMVAVDSLPLLAKDMAKVKADKAREQAKTRPRDATGWVKPVDPKSRVNSTRERNEAAAGAAKIAKVSRAYVEEAKRLKNKNPEIAERVRLGEITVSRGRDMARADEIARADPELGRAVKSGKKKDLAQAERVLKERAKDERRAENKAKVEATATAPRQLVSAARYATIVADPPWSPEAAGVVDVVGRSNPEYSTMGVAAIAALTVDGKRVAELSDVDAHCYLWVVNRTMQAGFGVLEEWGFRFVTILTWCKPSIGLGNYYRNNTEHVLFGVKGSQRLKRADVGTWFAAKRGPAGHSSKPKEFYDMVDACSPGPVLELFSRRERDGWVSWGEGE